MYTTSLQLLSNILAVAMTSYMIIVVMVHGKLIIGVDNQQKSCLQGQQVHYRYFTIIISNQMMLLCLTVVPFYSNIF